MKIKLPIAIKKNNEVYPELSIITPSPAVVADTKRIVDVKNDFYTAMHVFLSGCVECVYDTYGNVISDKILIKNIIRNIPFKSADYTSIQIMLLLDSNDGIEGIYPCPICHNKIIAQEIKDAEGNIEIDTRDFIGMLHVKYCENYNETIIYEFTEPIEIKRIGGEILEKIDRIELEFPTLANCINAMAKQNQDDAMRFQFAIYVDAITKINDREIDNRWKNMYGSLMFQSMKNYNDLKNLIREVDRYGIDPKVRKICTNCGKEFIVNVSTSNFFASGLRA